MTDFTLIQYTAGALMVTGWIGILAYTMLKGWNGWLALKRSEIELMATQHGAAGQMGSLPAATRIDIADLRERIRKLEAIASGVDP